MRKFLIALAFASCFSAPLAAADKAVTPNDVVDAAPAADWKRIAPDDLMVMELAPDAAGHPRRVVIQLMPAPFAQGWVGNIRKLVAARWFDGIAVVRTQDNYVVQWGDPDGEVPGKAKALPPGLVTVPEAEYTIDQIDILLAPFGDPRTPEAEAHWRHTLNATPPANRKKDPGPIDLRSTQTQSSPDGWHQRDSYAPWAEFHGGWPIASDGKRGADARFWPVHCYGMVGVGRNLSPDTGTGAELYTVIGQAPRQLDRNIALVGRIITGMAHLSSLPRGTGPLGFYETPGERTPIVSVRMGGAVADLPAYEYLSTDSASFAAYVDKRANRKDDFYIQPAGGVDICNVPVPVREVKR